MGKRTLAAAITIAVLGSVGFASAAFAGGGGRDFEAELRGKKEVPGPGDPDGRGSADVTVKAKSGKVCFELRWDNITTPTLGHIHAGKSDVAGPVVVDLLGGATTDELEEDNDYSSCVTADKALLANIAAHPRQYYVNIHNPRFPSGAIRGQLHG